MKIGLGIGLNIKKGAGESIPAAPVNIIQPFLVGNGTVGEAVICNKGTWSGSPTPTYTYDFRLDSVSVQNSSSNSYTPLLADDGKTLTCLVTATNSQGSASEGTSNSLVIGVAPSNTVAPTLSPSGTQSTGTVITVGNGTFAGTAPLTYAYRWKRNGSIILGETANTYTLVAGDDGTVITAEVKSTNAYGESAYIGTSNQVDAVNAIAPDNTAAPGVSGTAVVGQTLSSTTGTWTGIPTPTYSYQWHRGATLISGATNSTYTLVQADAGNTSNIKCVVTATNSAGSASADSNTVAQILTVRTNAFMTASGISDSTIRGGLNTFDIGLISNSLDTKMKAVYPLVGGTASTHRWNFMDARDLDAAFRVQYFGTWTHSSTGALPNGSNAFANTFLIPANSISNVNSLHLSYYSRTSAIGPFVASTSIGLYESATRSLSMSVCRNSGGGQFSGANSDDIRFLGVSNPNGSGFYINSRQSVTSLRGFKNGIEIAQNTSTAVHTLPTFRVLIAAAGNSTGTAIANTFDNHECAFASIGDGLSNAEAATFNSLVASLQTTLGRNV